MKLSKNKVIEEINKGDSLRYYFEWIDDKDVVLEAVKKNSWSLLYISERLRDDKEVVLEAVKEVGCALQYASERLRDDKEVVLKAVEQYAWALQYASERLRNDKEVVLAAIKRDKVVFKYASQEIKDNIRSNDNPVQCLEQWIKKEKLEQQLGKKENVGKIKI